VLTFKCRRDIKSSFFRQKLKLNPIMHAFCQNFVLLMLWSQIIYGHRTTSISPKIVRFYGARPAAGRIVRFLNIFFIVRCLVKFRYYLKFHGASTAFGRVNEGKMTSTWHRRVPGRHLHTSDGHWAIFV